VPKQEGAEGPEAARQTFYTRADWDRAVAAGTLTAEDVLARLTRIAVHEFGTEGPAAYDEDGFFLALTAEGLRVEGGVTLRVPTNDHPPPHVHVQRPGLADIKISLETGEPIEPVPTDASAKKLRGLQAAVRENRSQLVDWWEKNHGTLDVRN